VKPSNWDRPTSRQSLLYHLDQVSRAKNGFGGVGHEVERIVHLLLFHACDAGWRLDETGGDFRELVRQVAMWASQRTMERRKMTPRLCVSQFVFIGSAGQCLRLAVGCVWPNGAFVALLYNQRRLL